MNGFNQTITISCSGAPAKASCAPMSPSVTLNGSSATQVQINVTTIANSLLTHWITMRFPSNTRGLLALSSVALCILTFWGVFHRRQRAGYLALCLFTILAALCVVGCASGGGGSGPTSSNPDTPSGTYTLTVMGSTGSGTTSQTHSVTVALIVN
jgi:hypothetical protein